MGGLGGPLYPIFGSVRPLRLAAFARWARIAI